MSVLSSRAFDSADPAAPADAVSGRSRLAAFLAGFVAIWAVLQVSGDGTFSGARGVAGLIAVVTAAASVELLLWRTRPNQLGSVLGFGKPAAKPVLVAILAGAAIQIVYPLLWLATGRTVEPRPDWALLALGLFAYHGLAEEVAWRAYAFGRLRRGRSTRRALLLTMPLLAATHVPIVVSAGAVIGIGAMTVAAVTTVPFVRLYEAGRRTVWAPAVLHSAIDSFKLVSVPDDVTSTFSLLLVAVSLTIPLAVLPALRPSRPAARGTGRLCAPWWNVVRSAVLRIPCSTSPTHSSDEAPNCRSSSVRSPT